MASPLYRVTINHQSWNGLNVNVFHCSNAVVAPADFGAAAVTLFSGFYTDIETVFCSDSVISIGQIIDMSTLDPTYVPFDPTPFALSVSGNRLDARVAATITWRSVVATRRGRGRTFIGPLTPNVISDLTGLIDEAFVATLDSAAAALINSASVADIPLMVYSPTGATQNEVTGRHVGVTPRTLRSRTQR